jgi:hypothetical protein
MSELVMFIKNNYDVIGIVIGLVGVVVAVFGVIYGRKGYRVAKEIFDKGLRIDKKKVLQQVSLEFVTGFFIPFSKFKTAAKPIQEKTSDAQNVLHVRNMIEEHTFSVQFPYYDVHKGDVWDSLEICKEMEQADAFNAIADFVEEARKFDRAITDLYERLNDYLSPDNALESQRRAGATLQDFFYTSQSVNQEVFDKGMDMMDKLSEYENRLPKELEISEKKRQLYRD